MPHGIHSLYPLIAVVFIAVTTLDARVVLKDSTIINGDVYENTDSTISVANAYLGTIVIPKRYLIENYRKSENGAYVSGQWSGGNAGNPAYLNDPNTNLIFAPTARTCRKGVFDFKDFELLFLTLSYSPSNSTILSTGFLFPITTEFQLYSFAIKQQIYKTPDNIFAAAIMGQISKPVGNEMDDIHYFFNTFATCSFQPTPQFSLHGSLLFSGSEVSEYDYYSYQYDEEEKTVFHSSFNYMLGMEVVPTSHTKFIVEFFDNLGVLNSFAADGDAGIYFINFALRLFWSKISVDIAGLRPVGPNVDVDELLLIPFVNISYRFGGQN